MYNAKVKCVKGDWRFNKGTIYEVHEGVMWHNSVCLYDEINSLSDLNDFREAQFEEVREGKITLLLEDGCYVGGSERKYLIYKLKDYWILKVEHKKSGYIEHEIRWGNEFGTTLRDVKPILDVFNVNIIEPPKKYKINTDKDYTEDEKAELEKLGIEFEEIN